MSYFDGLADAIFKYDSEGNAVFYPWGVLGKGYIIPDESRKNDIRNFIKKIYIISLPAMIVAGLFLSWSLCLSILSVYTVWYYYMVKKITKQLRVSTLALGVGESYKNSAESYNTATLWILFIFSIIFVLAGIAALSGLLPSENGKLKGIAVVIFFGACSIAIGYMIKNKNR